MNSTSLVTASTPLTAGLNLLKIPQECWRPFENDSGRKSDRTGERELERLEVAIRFPDARDWIPVRLRDYSLYGFGLSCAAGLHAHGIPETGAAVEVRFHGLGPSAHVIHCEVRNCSNYGDGFRIGLRRLDLLGPDQESQSTRPGRYLLRPSMKVPARIENPILFREWGEAFLTGFGLGNEWIFESSDPSLLLFKEMPLGIRFDLPMQHGGECRGEIIWTRSDADDARLLFGIRWTTLPFQVSNAVGEHLLQAGGCKPAELRPYGVHLRRFIDQLKFSVVNTMDEYRQVLDLRREAYAKAGKVAASASPEQLASRHDRHSRILAAFREDDLVACLGLTFPKDRAFRLRSESLFPGGKYPVRVPSKETLIEAHSFCTRPEYRGGDLLRGIFEQVGRCLLLSDRDWIITMATEELWPLYRRIGFKRLGASAPVDFLGGLEHHLILMHRSSFLFARRMTPSTWNYFFGDLVRDLLDKRYLELPPHRAAYVKALSLLGKSWFGNPDSRLEKEFRQFLKQNSK